MLHGATKECFLLNYGVKQAKHTEGENQMCCNERWSVASVTPQVYINYMAQHVVFIRNNIGLKRRCCVLKHNLILA